MKNTYNSLLAFFLGVTLVSCAGFSYKYYGLDIPSYQGKLLGKAASDDIPFEVCQPDAQTKGKCVVLMADEFEKILSDMADKDERLKACETPK